VEKCIVVDHGFRIEVDYRTDAKRPSIQRVELREKRRVRSHAVEMPRVPLTSEKALDRSSHTTPAMHFDNWRRQSGKPFSWSSGSRRTAMSPPRNETCSGELPRGDGKSLIRLSAERGSPFRVPGAAFNKERVEKVVLIEEWQSESWCKLASHCGLPAPRQTREYEKRHRTGRAAPGERRLRSPRLRCCLRWAGMLVRDMLIQNSAGERCSESFGEQSATRKHRRHHA